MSCARKVKSNDASTPFAHGEGGGKESFCPPFLSWVIVSPLRKERVGEMRFDEINVFSFSLFFHSRRKLA